VDIKVKAETINGAVEWTIDGKKPKASVIELPHKSGRHTLDFKIEDRTGLGFRFDDSDPIWAHENEDGKCPAQGIHTTQVKVVSCKPQKLSVTDDNSGDPCTLQYQLNVVDAGGLACPIDPIIKNGGGTTFI
jgi:hypothetical protein